jgi:hypothetical protein
MKLSSFNFILNDYARNISCCVRTDLTNSYYKIILILRFLINVSISFMCNKNLPM